MNQVAINNLSKKYGSTKALSDINLTLRSGEFGCVIGPNGCGKSTLLKIAAGILSQSSGEVKLSGRLAYLPQAPSLLPWKTVQDNLILPGLISGEPITKAKASKLLKKFGLQKFARHYPGQLSGGMQQKLGILRSLITEPDVVLLDEPFSALDAITKLQMHRWTLDVWAEYKPSVILVTHDIREAIFLSDKIYVMSSRPGTIKQILKVDLPRPRTLDDMSNVSVKILEQKLLELLAV